MKLLFPFVCILILLFAAISGECLQLVPLDDFEDSQQWGFTNGGEFPGASGQIECINNQLLLHYDFSKGGGYVGAVYHGMVLPQLQRYIVTAVSNNDCRVNYRITDLNGRIFQAFSTTIKANTKTSLSFPVNTTWEGAWDGNKGETAQPEGAAALWICVQHTADNPVTGTLRLSAFGAEVQTDKKLLVTGPAVSGIPLKKTANPKMAECYFPKEEKLGDLRVFMGYNEPGEAANDARDLRITTKEGRYLVGLWGRLQVKGKTEYVTPTDFLVRTGRTGETTYWEWDNSDARIGFQQLVRTKIDPKGVTSTIYVKFLKSHEGSIVIPCVVPDSQAKFYAGDGDNNPYVQLLTSKRASRVEYSIGNEKLYILNSVNDPTGVSFSHGQKLWMHFFRSELPLMYITIKPADGNTFPKGYTNAIQLRFTPDPNEALPKFIEQPAWNTGVGIYIMEKDSAGNTIIPRVNRPHIFYPDQKKQLDVALYNLSASSKRKIDLEYLLKDYSNNTVLKGSRSLTIDANMVGKVKLDLPVKSRGIFSLTMMAKHGKSILARKTTRLSVVPKPALVDVEDSFFGIDPLFVEGSRENMDMLRKLGIRWLRLGGGVWYPAEGDKAHLQTLKDNGIGYFLLIENTDMVRSADYNNLINYYEISNEPDGWTNPEDYAKIAKPIYDKAKQINPDVNVLGCSVSGGDSDSDFAFTRRFLAAGGADICQGIPYHPYSSIRAFGPGLQPVSPEENRLYEKMIEGRRLCSEAELRTWIGEVGFLTINAYRFPVPDFHKYEKGYANYMARLFLISKCIPGLERVIWFHLCLDDTPLNLFAAYYGTYDSMGPNNTITPCLTAYANLASLIDGSKFVKKLAFEYPDVWGVQTNKQGHSVVALWAAKDSCYISFKHSGSLKFINIVGAESVIKPVNGIVRLHVTDEPIYIVIPDSMSALVGKIEKSNVVFDEPVSIGGLSVVPGGKLSISLKNKYNRPLKASIRLTVGSSKENWNISLKAKEDKALLLTARKNTIFDSAKSIKVEVVAEHRSTVRSVQASSIVTTPDLIAARSREKVTIDGELKEWGSAVEIVSDKHEQVTPPDPGFWKGPDDLSFSAYLMHDDKYLYFACKVRDDVHKNDEIPGKIWAGDSIQLGLANQNNPYNYTEINFGSSSVAGDVAFETMGPESGKEVEGLKFACRKVDGGMVYEAAIPFDSLKGIAIGSGAMLRCAFIVNDIDKTARKWIGIDDPGLIGANKEAKYFPVMFLRP